MGKTTSNSKWRQRPRGILVGLALSCHPGSKQGGIVPPLPVWPLGRRSSRSPALLYPPPRPNLMIPEIDCYATLKLFLYR